MPQSIRSTTAARAAVFAPLAGGGRAELVAQRLTDAIELGLLAHGERLPSETEMARQFGVATVTTREALETLRDKGLVETRRGRDGGSFVVSENSRTASIDRRVKALSRVELRDMGVYYSAIAAMAADLAADRATPGDIQHLRATISTAGRPTPTVPKDTSARGGPAAGYASEASARRGEGTFRLEVAALSQSARLVREELRLQAEFAPLLWLCLREPEYRERSRLSHIAVVDAIEAMDGEGARRTTVEHVAEAIEWLLEAKAELEGKD